MVIHDPRISSHWLSTTKNNKSERKSPVLDSLHEQYCRYKTCTHFITIFFHVIFLSSKAHGICSVKRRDFFLGKNIWFKSNCFVWRFQVQSWHALAGWLVWFKAKHIAAKRTLALEFLYLGLEVCFLFIYLLSLKEIPMEFGLWRCVGGLDWLGM